MHGPDVHGYSAFDWRRKAVLWDLPCSCPSDFASSGCIFACWLEVGVETGTSGSAVETRLDRMMYRLPLVAGGRWLGYPVNAFAEAAHLGGSQRWVVVGIDDVCPIAWTEFQAHGSGFLEYHG